MNHTRIFLDEERLSVSEAMLVEGAGLSASAFKFDSGVTAVRIKNDFGNVVLLPFQGQQIWSATMRGREMGMISVCKQPRPGVPFLETFGGFLQHCGLLAMGAPGPGDSHPLHGELPNARFDKAWLTVGSDQGRMFLGLEGEYSHAAVFGSSYIAQTSFKLFSDSSLFEVGLKVQNRSAKPMELMYMAHINFRAVTGGRLDYSTRVSPKTVRVRASIPSHIKTAPGYAEWLKELEQHPELHHQLKADLKADPEIVLCLDYLADAEGWAHSLHTHPDGHADYVAHRPSELPRATRWISLTPDHNSLALVEPGTAEPEGYTAEKRKGNIKVVPAHGTYECNLQIGALAPQDAEGVRGKIARIVG
jgi:hypothetical protein